MPSAGFQKIGGFAVHKTQSQEMLECVVPTVPRAAQFILCSKKPIFPGFFGQRAQRVASARHAWSLAVVLEVKFSEESLRVGYTSGCAIAFALTPWLPASPTASKPKDM